MKKFLWILVLGWSLNFYISVQALDSPKNYLKGKFYSSIKDYFLVATEKMLDNTFYFIAQKLNTISTENAPSYSSIVKLKRIGLNGKIIIAYKYRTMHPYSLSY